MRWKVVLAALGLLVIVVLLLPVSGSRNSAHESLMADLSLEERVVAAAGLVEPASEARQLAATVIGRLVKVNFEEGDRVAAGAIIAEIENDDLKAQEAQAQATLMARESELLRLKTGARPQEIAAARAELRQAEATAKLAGSNQERRDMLGDKNIVSKEAVDQAHADREGAEARKEFLAQKLALLVAPPRVEDVAIAQANEAGAKARLAEIRAQIEKTLVRAPIDGTVLKINRRGGETVTNFPPTEIATVGDTSRLRVRADIDEADVGLIALGQTVSVTADAYRDKRFKGTVTHIGAQLGPKNFRNNNPEERIDTKILEVVVDLEPGARLPIGLPVDIKFGEMPRLTRFSDASDTSLRRP